MWRTTKAWVTVAIRLFSAASSFWPAESNLPSTKALLVSKAGMVNFIWLGLDAIDTPAQVGDVGLEAGQEPGGLVVHDGAVVDAGLEHVEADVVVLADGADHLGPQLALVLLRQVLEDVG